jgi:hypothetical protein
LIVRSICLPEFASAQAHLAGNRRCIASAERTRANGQAMAARSHAAAAGHITTSA